MKTVATICMRVLHEYAHKLYVANESVIRAMVTFLSQAYVVFSLCLHKLIQDICVYFVS